MAVQTTKTNKPINPRGNDQSPKGYNRAALYSGKALDFDGVNDNIVASSFSGLSGEAKASVSLYMNFDSINSSENWLIGQDTTSDRVFAFGYKGSTNEIRLQINGTNTTDLDTFVLTAGEWYHYLFTFDTTTNAVVIYVNGQQVATGTQTKDLISATSDLYVGQREYPSAEGRVNGKIANVKIFNEVLTAAQVADLYNNPEKIVPTGVANSALKLYLPMMEGAGTTAYDGSGNGNHGTISGATWTHGIGAPVAQTAVIDWNKASNLVIQSNDFTTSWTGNSVSLTTAQAGPTGINDAWKLEKVAAYGNIVQGISVNNASTYTFSIIAKAGDTDFVSIRFSTGAGYDYRHKIDLTNGTTSTASGDDSSGVTYKTQNIGDGWWRFGIVCTTNSTSAFVNAYAGDTADASGYVYIAHAHAQETNELKPYVRTYASSLTNVLLPQGLTSGRDITGVNLFENVRKQGALNLDGNSWAEVHDNASLDFGTGSFTLEAWARVAYVNGGSSYNAILTLGGNAADDTSLSTTSSLETRFEYAGNSSSVSSSTEGDWVHLVGTYDETNATFYINGSQADQDARVASDITNALVKHIGRDATSIRFYNDQIAQPRIYNRALTAEEVARNYDAGKNIYTNS